MVCWRLSKLILRSIKMTKDVMISIRGIQFDNGQDGEKIESIQRGEYYHKNN